MALAVIARFAGRASFRAGRYAIRLARTRSGEVIGGAMMAERATRPVRLGYGISRVYSRLLDRGAVQETASGGKHSRGASFEYIYKY